MVISLNLGIVWPDMSVWMILAGIGCGTMIALFGVWSFLTARNPAADRIAALGQARHGRENGKGLIKQTQGELSGVLGSLAPEAADERFQVTQALAQAGFRGSGAPAKFYTIRVVLGLGLPFLFTALLAISRNHLIGLPFGLGPTLNGMSALAAVETLAILAALGFFGPAFWLRHLISQRKQKISDAFPNALDMIQVAVEAGLGFDAAMKRVASEIAEVAPDLSQEMMAAFSEIQAGRDRARALGDLARRTGVDEVSTFSNVVLQSLEFGTPISTALTTYAKEMRLARELKAQEKANKLPVQMSAVMASLMLPAILLLTLGPVVIRYAEYFASQ